MFLAQSVSPVELGEMAKQPLTFIEIVLPSPSGPVRLTDNQTGKMVLVTNQAQPTGWFVESACSNADVLNAVRKYLNVPTAAVQVVDVINVTVVQHATVSALAVTYTTAEAVGVTIGVSLSDIMRLAAHAEQPAIPKGVVVDWEQLDKVDSAAAQ